MKEIKLEYQGQTLTLTKSGQANFNGHWFDVDIDFVKGIVKLSDVCDQTLNTNIVFDELKYITDNNTLKNATNNKAPLITLINGNVFRAKYTYDNIHNCMYCIGLDGSTYRPLAQLVFNYDISKMTPQEQLALILKIEFYTTTHINQAFKVDDLVSVWINLKEAGGITNTVSFGLTSKTIADVKMLSSKSHYTSIFSQLMTKIAKNVNFTLNSNLFERPSENVPFIVTGIQKDFLKELSILSAKVRSTDEMLNVLDVARYCDNISTINILNARTGKSLIKIVHQEKTVTIKDASGKSTQVKTKQKTLNMAICEPDVAKEALNIINSLYVDKFTTKTITTDGKSSTFYIAGGYDGIAFTDKKILKYGDVPFTSAVVMPNYDKTLDILKTPCNVTINTVCTDALPSDLKFSMNIHAIRNRSTTYGNKSTTYETSGNITCYKFNVLLKAGFTTITTASVQYVKGVSYKGSYANYMCGFELIDAPKVTITDGTIVLPNLFNSTARDLYVNDYSINWFWGKMGQIKTINGSSKDVYSTVKSRYNWNFDTTRNIFMELVEDIMKRGINLSNYDGIYLEKIKIIKYLIDTNNNKNLNTSCVNMYTNYVIFSYMVGGLTGKFLVPQVSSPPNALYTTMPTYNDSIATIKELIPSLATDQPYPQNVTVDNNPLMSITFDLVKINNTRYVGSVIYISVGSSGLPIDENLATLIPQGLRYKITFKFELTSDGEFANNYIDIGVAHGSRTCSKKPSTPPPPDTVDFTISKDEATGIISVKYVNNSKHKTKYVGINGLKLDKKGAQ